MAHPRAARMRGFTNGRRAVVLEAEWMVMAQRIANELKPLVKLAKDQGWRIDSNPDGTRLIWRGPNGEGPVYTGYRCQGRELMNYRAELVRAGLKLDEETARQHLMEKEAEALFDKTENINMDEVKAAMDIVSGSLAFLIVKAENFDRIRSDCAEWESIANESQEAATKALEQRDVAEALVMNIRNAFSLQPWAILPEIARLLDIDAGGTINGSISQQATTGRRAV